MSFIQVWFIHYPLYQLPGDPRENTSTDPWKTQHYRQNESAICGTFIQDLSPQLTSKSSSILRHQAVVEIPSLNLCNPKPLHELQLELWLSRGIWKLKSPIRFELRVGRLGGVDMRIWTAPRDGLVSDKLYWATGKRIAPTNPNQKTYHVNYILKQVRLQRLGTCMEILSYSTWRWKMSLEEQTQTGAL